MSKTSPASQAPLCVIGSPVAQSMSPALFRRLFAASDVESALVAREIPAGDVEALKAVCAEVRREDLAGFCVTAPHKQAIVEHLDVLDDTARFCGAVNWVTPVREGLRGSNTDVAGVIAALATQGKTSAAHVLILGAGGAARAAVCAAVKLGAEAITIANRTIANAESLVATLAQRTERIAPGATPAFSVVALTDADPGLIRAFDGADVVINATSGGLNAPAVDPLPAALQFGYGHTVLDMVYRPLQTRLLVRALAEGARVVDGLAMLIAQAVEGFGLVQESQPQPRTLPADFSPLLHRELATQILKEDGQLESSESNPFILAGRARINAIDEEIIALLGNRFATARAIGEVKACLSEPVVRPEREVSLRQLHRDWAAQHRSPPAVVEAVYDAVLAASRAAQSALQTANEEDDDDDN